MTGEREVAEDLLQETFLAAYRNALQFDRSRSFLSWLFGIAHKRTIDYFRHARVENDHQEEAVESVGSRMGLPDEHIANENMRDIISAAVVKVGSVSAGSIHVTGNRRSAVQGNSGNYELSDKYRTGPNAACP